MSQTVQIHIKPSLPQKDGFFQHEERKAQLALSREIYDYNTTASDTAPGWQKGKKLMAPIALFVKTDDFPGLQPVAIQLDQSPESLVYLASDGTQPDKKYQWLMAKIFLQCADLNLNQVVNHLTRH